MSAASPFLSQRICPSKFAVERRVFRRFSDNRFCSDGVIRVSVGVCSGIEARSFVSLSVLLHISEMVILKKVLDEFV